MFLKIKNEKGVALAISLLVVVVILILGSAFIIRSTSEKAMSDRERMLTQAFYVGDGGSHAGLSQLDTIINTDMLTTVNATNPQVLGNDAQSYVNAANSLGFLIKYAKNGGTALFTLDMSGTKVTNTGTETSLGSGSYQYNIIVTAKGNPITVSTDKWDFPYYYNIQTTGTVNGVVRKVSLNGDFTVRVQRDNFAKYALFTDHQTMPSGTTVWFTNKTNFAGPLFTNDQFNFAFNPSGTFTGDVSQQNTKARFYNQGNPVQIDANNNTPYDVPIFDVGFTRGAALIVLSSSVQQQDLQNEAKGTDTSTGNGIYVPNNGSSLTGGIYVKGDTTVNLGVDGSDNAVYTVTQGTTTKTITVNIPSNQTTVVTSGGGTVTYSGLPNGVDGLGTIIYVNGAINSLAGTVQRNTAMTVSSQSDIVITNHLKYENYTPGVGTPGTAGYIPPTADGTTNLLGIVSWGGNVRISESAPGNIEIHGPVMARNGIFTADNYASRSPAGTATILGGVITQFYGAFGTFNGSTGQLVSGYGKNFVYDSRMIAGTAPPYFPTMKTFIAFTNDITDKISWQEGGF